MKKTLFFAIVLLFYLQPICQAMDCNQAQIEGFSWYQVKRGDTLWKIASLEDWTLIKKINRVDEKHLPQGKKILIPQNLEMEGLFIGALFLPVKMAVLQLVCLRFNGKRLTIIQKNMTQLCLLPSIFPRRVISSTSNRCPADRLRMVASA